MTTSQRWQRILIALGCAVIAYAILAPLTSLDGAQALNLPLLTDKLW